MLLRGKQLNDIEADDLRALAANKVFERKAIEYKQELPGGNDADKKEFLADVSSFANASGGHIIFGMAEKGEEDDKALELCGLGKANVDTDILRLENCARDGISPRIVGIHTVGILLGDANSAIVMQIPNSWNSPHRVIFGGHDKFYTRDSNGKHPMDVDELRAAFILSETVAKRARDFRAERLAKIIANETALHLPSSPIVVLHIVPMTAFGISNPIDLKSVRARYRHKLLPPMHAAQWAHRFNLDGLLTSSLPPPIGQSYVQLFRTGAIEAVDAIATTIPGGWAEHSIVPAVWVEQAILEKLPEYLRTQRDLGIELPALVMLSILGMQGQQFWRTTGDASRESIHPVDRDDLILEEAVIEDLGVNIEEVRKKVEEVLRPVFDQMWNASGWPGSPSYDEEGNWQEPS